MTPITTKQWVRALRSGKYSQIQDALCDGSGFCCLGVLAEEAGVQWETTEGRYRNYLFPKASDPSRVSEETGLIPLAAAPLLTDLYLQAKMPEAGTIQNHLVQLNDNGRSFDEIADEIERLSSEHNK